MSGFFSGKRERDIGREDDHDDDDDDYEREEKEERVCLDQIRLLRIFGRPQFLYLWVSQSDITLFYLLVTVTEDSGTDRGLQRKRTESIERTGTTVSKRKESESFVKNSGHVSVTQ